MTIHADTVWEIRITGAQTNGGGFYNRVSGVSVDYSQQDSAQLSLADIATDGVGTGLSSVTGGFTAAMQGNIIYLTGGDVTAGWYEIIGYTDGNNITIDRSAGLNKVGVTGNVGGAFKIGGSLDTEFFQTNQKVAGNKIWIKAGTYTLGENLIPNVPGTVAAPIVVEGYNTSRGDSPIGTNRPTLGNSSNYFYFMGIDWIFRNLIFTSTNTSQTVLADVVSRYFNCKFGNTGVSGNRYSLNLDGPVMVASCEITSSNIGVYWNYSVQCCLINCYIHDCETGIYAYNSPIILLNSVIDTCTTGINLGNYVLIAIGNVIYNCTTGISATTSTYGMIVNNIISGCTTGASWGGSNLQYLIDYNCWNNTVDVVNITKGPNDITADPKLKDPDNGDFTLDAGSPCFNAGMQLGAVVGL